MDNPRAIKILQHNVRNWKTHKCDFYNIYRNEDPDIILINEHELRIAETMNMFNYNVHHSNKSNEYNDGVAVAVRKNITYKLIDNFTDEVIAIRIHTPLGEIIIGTVYLPLRRRLFKFNKLQFTNLHYW